MAEHIKVILTEALEKETESERKAYLDKVCGTDLNLRTEVESLLRSYDNAGDFLEASPFGQDVTLDTSPLSESPGTIIDKYKLLEKIGEGGMAVVYMAEQEKPLRRKVALKIIKLGMDTKSVIARFEVERQALAMMEHPNIAKVLDAGATETGRPYFVMELVKGVSITEYCDKNTLKTKERLDLFISVCNAVQHAHQKGIIHRDIKPSNVMVTLRDGKPVPKVIDFGIAKATSQRLTEKTLFTQYAQMIGTPAYMSPEQAEFSELDIDTRTDIYSLGVLLYELLTGATPLDEEKLREAGYLEMQRIIREEEPAKPSTKLSTLGEALTDVADHRKASPDLLRKLIIGDLDWIVMKSLEKDRTRRYDTATELSADIDRHLNNEPVLAAAPSPLYRAHKFVRRHRLGVTAGLLIAAALIIGATGTTIGFIQVSNQRKLAEAQYQRAEGNLDLILQSLDAILLKAGPESGSGLRRTFRLLEELSTEFPQVPDFRGDLVKCYVELASCLKASAGEQAERSYQNVLRILESMQAEVMNLPPYRLPVALLHNDLALILKESGDQTKAKHHYVQAIELFEKLVSDSPDVASHHAQLAEGLSFLATSTDEMQPEKLYRKAFDHIRVAIRLDTEKTSYREMLVRKCRRLDDKRCYEQAIAQLESVPVDVTDCRRELTFLLANMSTMLRNLGQLEDSVAAQRRAEIYWRQITDPLLRARFFLGSPANLGTAFNTWHNEGAPKERADGLERFLGSDRSGTHGDYDLWVATRATTGDDWSSFVNLGPTVNTSYFDSNPSISASGLELYFASERPGGRGSADIWITTRGTTSDPWSVPVNLGSPVNSPKWEAVPWISADGLSLYFESERPGGYGNVDIWVTTRSTVFDVWGVPMNLGSAINSVASDGAPSITNDGLVLFFTSHRGGFGNYDLWLSIRATTGDTWGPPVNLGPTVNSRTGDGWSAVSADGSMLYFASKRSGGHGRWDAWQTRISWGTDGPGRTDRERSDQQSVRDNDGKEVVLEKDH